MHYKEAIIIVTEDNSEMVFVFAENIEFGMDRYDLGNTASLIVKKDPDNQIDDVIFIDRVNGLIKTCRVGV